MPRIEDHTGEGRVNADVVIVGARCAGSAAATAFAKSGRRVIVLDRARFPSETISSHTIFGAGVTELRTMGALPRVLSLDPSPLVTVHVESSNSDAPTVYRKPAFDGADHEPTISVPRVLLDEQLVATARDAGADVREDATVIDVLWSGGRASGVVYVDPDGNRQRLKASLVVGADGQFSTVADLVGAGTPYRYSHSQRCAVYRYVKDLAPEPDSSTVYHWRDRTSMGFGFPTTPRGTMLVMFIADRGELDLARRDSEAYWQLKLQHHPSVAARLEQTSDPTPVRITDALASYFRTSSGPGWALIGDAGHFKDPIIGQGIRDALWAGRTLAEHTAQLIDDPAELDRAMRIWEDSRDRECLLTYLVAVHEARMVPDSAGLRAVIQQLNNVNLPLAEALAARDGSITKLLTPKLAATTILAALRASEDPRSCATDLVHEVTLFAKMILNSRRSRFRDTKSVPELENVEGGWPRQEAMIASPPAQYPPVSSGARASVGVAQ
jgi:flavin-dependent dehydrogenase